MRDKFHWARILSFVTGLVNQELLLRNEYLTAENRILRAHLPARLRLSDAERSTRPRSRNDSAVKPSGRSFAWPSQKPFWPGIGNSWHTSSTALAFAAIRADQDIARTGDTGGADGSREPRLGI